MIDSDIDNIIVKTLKVLIIIIMVALCNRADNYIFILWFLLSFFLFLA